MRVAYEEALEKANAKASELKEELKKKTTCSQCTTSEDRNGSFIGNGEEN